MRLLSSNRSRIATRGSSAAYRVRNRPVAESNR
jgi:hypothetical protein